MPSRLQFDPCLITSMEAGTPINPATHGSNSRSIPPNRCSGNDSPPIGRIYSNALSHPAKYARISYFLKIRVSKLRAKCDRTPLHDDLLIPHSASPTWLPRSVQVLDRSAAELSSASTAMKRYPGRLGSRQTPNSFGSLKIRSPLASGSV